MTLRQCVQYAIQQLQNHSESPRLDAEILLAHLLAMPRSYLIAHPERELTATESVDFVALITRRQQGEPIAYIKGYKEFWSLELYVTPATLIPRPETELLVQLALDKLPASAGLKIADLGTGSGAIALALASERPQWEIHAVDNSAAALQVAKYNAQRLNMTNVVFTEGNWCAALPKQPFTAILSNPPYLAEHDSHLTNLHFEPSAALIAGDGLLDLRTIINQAFDYLMMDGWLMLEHGAEQGHAVMALMQNAGYTHIINYLDLAGLSRVTIGRKVY